MSKFTQTITQYAGLPREIYVLFIARIINRMGGFVHMFLTLFLSSKLGLNKAEIGFYILLLGIGGIIGPMIGGFLADHLGRKKVYLVVQVLAASMLIPCGFLGTSIYIFWLLVAFNFFGSMVRPISSAMVTDLSPADRRKDAFSLLYLGINFGVAIGPILAGFLFNNYIEWIFWGDAITTFIAMALILIYIPETKPTHEVLEASKDNETDERAEEGNFLTVLLRRPLLLIFSLIGFFGAFIYAQHSFTIPLQLEQLFGDESAAGFGYLMSFNAIVVIVCTGLVMSLTRHIKPIYNMMLAYLFYMIGFGLLAFAGQYNQTSLSYSIGSVLRMLPNADELSLFYISFFIWTIGEILATTNSGVYIANHAPMSHRGRFNAIISIIMGSGFTVGPAITGLILMEVSFSIHWLFIGTLSAITALFAYMLGQYEEKNRHREVNYQGNSM